MLEAAGSSFFDSLSAEDTESAGTLKQLRDPNATVSAKDADQLVSLLVRRKQRSPVRASATKFNVTAVANCSIYFFAATTSESALLFREIFNAVKR